MQTLFESYTVDQLKAELRSRRIYFPSRHLKHQLIELVQAHGTCTNDQARQILAWRGRHRTLGDVTSPTAAADWLRAADADERARPSSSLNETAVLRNSPVNASRELG